MGKNQDRGIPKHNPIRSAVTPQELYFAIVNARESGINGLEHSTVASLCRKSDLILQDPTCSIADSIVSLLMESTSKRRQAYQKPDVFNLVINVLALKVFSGNALQGIGSLTLKMCRLKSPIFECFCTIPSFRILVSCLGRANTGGSVLALANALSVITEKAVAAGTKNLITAIMVNFGDEVCDALFSIMPHTLSSMAVQVVSNLVYDLLVEHNKVSENELLKLYFLMEGRSEKFLTALHERKRHISSSPAFDAFNKACAGVVSVLEKLGITWVRSWYKKNFAKEDQSLGDEDDADEEAAVADSTAPVKYKFNADAKPFVLEKRENEGENDDDEFLEGDQDEDDGEFEEHEESESECQKRANDEILRQQQQQKAIEEFLNKKRMEEEKARQIERDCVEFVLAVVENRDRQQALAELSKLRDQYPDLAVLLWHSVGFVAVLLQEIIAGYRFIDPSHNITNGETNRICYTLTLLETIASHHQTRRAFLQSHLHSFLYPFLNTTSSDKPYEFLRLTSLGVIGALVRADEIEVIQFLLSTDIVPLCLRIMERSTELSRTVATFIMQKILATEIGLNYVCMTPERFVAVAQSLKSEVSDNCSVRLLRHIVRCYLCLTEHPQACKALRTCLPDKLKDGTFKATLEGDVNAKKWLIQLLGVLYSSGDEEKGV